MKKFIIAALLLVPTVVSADEAVPCTPEPGGKCLTKQQLENVVKALEELKSIHEAPATVEFDKPITIIEDWKGRVYVNGGSTDPIKMKVKIGQHIDRDLMVNIPTQVHYREQPPDPMFRLRIRAQAGILVPQLIQTVTDEKKTFWDAGVGWDFFHLGAFNVSAYTGVFSAGLGPGLDLTKNFGVYGGYSFIYDGFISSGIASAYFSFN